MSPIRFQLGIGKILHPFNRLVPGKAAVLGKFWRPNPASMLLLLLLCRITPTLRHALTLSVIPHAHAPTKPEIDRVCEDPEKGPMRVAERLRLEAAHDSELIRPI